jgi:glycopeptide antibiotics resistance protein
MGWTDSRALPGGHYQGFLMKILQTNRVAFGYLLLLLILAVIPFSKGSTSLNNTYTLHIRGDYLVHALFYIPLPVFLLLSRWGRQKGWMPVILLSLMAVVLLESVQMLIPYRAFNINDMIANGVGVVIGLLFFVSFGNRLLKITDSSN